MADPTLTLPRILCLHGGGVNADVFRMQSRAIIARLKPHFRLVFVDGPFICPPHASIVAVYGDHGPFRRWLRWLPVHQEVDAETATSEIRYQVQNAMDDDNAMGGTGEWVGLLGFSQGAKVAASLLYTQQVVEEAFPPEGKGVAETNGNGNATTDGRQKGLSNGVITSRKPRWQFGVLMAGRGPVVLLDERFTPVKGVADASMGSTTFTDWPEEGDTKGKHLLRLPTIHVHGMRDPGLDHHLRLLRQYCAAGTTRVVEWDGDHRIPIKSTDVDAVAGQIIELATELGILQR